MAQTLRVAIVGDASSYSRSLQKAGGQTETFGKKLGGLGKTAGLAAGAAGIGALTFAIKTGVSEWANQQKVAAQTAAVIKTTGSVAHVTAGHVQDLATEIEHYSGIDDEAIKSSENLLLAFTGVRNEVGKGNNVFDRAIKVITDYSVRTGKSATAATQLFGKALNEIAQGQIPTSIRGLGKLSQALQDEIKAHVKAGDAVGAQGLLLAELEKRYGGAAKAAGDTLPGQLSILRERFNDLTGEGVQLAIDKFEELKPTLDTIVEIIRGLTPVLKPLVTLWFDAIVTPLKIITDLLRGDFSQAWKDIKKPIEDIKNVFTGLGTILSEPIGKMVAAVKGLAGELWSGFTSTFQSVFVTPFTTAWNTVADWFGKAEGFVVQVVGWIGGLPKKAWDAYVTLFETIYVRPFKAAFDALANWLVGPDGFVTKAAGFISNLPSKIVDFSGALVSRITGFFTGSGLLGFFEGRAAEWAGAIAALPSKIGDFGKELLNKITGFIDNAGIGTYLTDKIDDFAGFFTSLPGKIGDALGRGVTGAIGKLKSWFNDLFGWLPGWAKDILGIHSPSTVFAEIGEHIVGGLIKGLGSMSGALKKKVEDLIGVPIDWANKAISAIGGALGGEATGGYKSIASHLLGSYGWAATEFMPLQSLWEGESGWNPHAENPSSHAYGIPQSLPWTKMPQSAWPERAGGHSDPAAQIQWGLAYIKSRYGSPSAAYNAWLSRSPHWYAKGGIFTKPSIIGVGEKGPEAVVPLGKMRGDTYVTVNMPNYLGDKREAARTLRDEITRLNRDNAILGT